MAKVVAEFHAEPSEVVPALVAVYNGSSAPPGVARRDLDNWPVPGGRRNDVDLGGIRFPLDTKCPAHDVDALGDR